MTTPTRDQLVAQLRAAGLRATQARVVVLAALHRLSPGDEAVSHPELAAALAPEGWDRATVYRNLIDLVEAGIASRHDMGDHTWRFALKGHAPAPSVVGDDGGVSAIPDGHVTVRPWAGCADLLGARDRKLDRMLSDTSVAIANMLADAVNDRLKELCDARNWTASEALERGMTIQRDGQRHRIMIEDVPFSGWISVAFSWDGDTAKATIVEKL